MKEHENLYRKIQEFLGGEPGNVKILEQQIDLDLQMEYYECSRKLQQEVGEEWALERAQYLGEPGYSPDVKKEILARLATVDRVECFRMIEEYVGIAEEELRDWALLSLNESRMHLESNLLDENQVFISTGLGGKEQKLRYFVVLLSRGCRKLDPTQKKVISNEFELTFRNYHVELEEIRFSEYMATLMLLLPVNCSLGDVFREAIGECNRYGDFLSNDFIVTNVRSFSFQEIKAYLERKGKSG